MSTSPSRAGVHHSRRRERVIRAVALNGRSEQRLDFLGHGPRFVPRLPPRIRRLVVHGEEAAVFVPDIG